MSEQQISGQETEASSQPDQAKQDKELSSEGRSRRRFLKGAAAAGGMAALGAGGRLLAKILADWSEKRESDLLGRLAEGEDVQARPTVYIPKAPGPTATPGSIELTPTRVPFGPSETGTFNAEALASWVEVEQQPKLDTRLGISLLPSRYVRGEGAVGWHNVVAERLGFQRVAVVLSPPEYKNHTGIEIPSGTTITQLAQGQGYDQIFANPSFKAIHVTCDVGNPEAANGWQFPQGDFTEERLQRTYGEYREFADYLLENFGHLGKEITVGGPNEMELLGKNGYRADTEDSDLPPAVLKNAIAYYNTFHRAIRDANTAYAERQPLETGIEVLQIRTLFSNPDAQNGLSGVIPYLEFPPDEVTLSAWQFSGKGSEPGYWIGAAVDLMKREAPRSQVAISEYGLADRDWPGLSREQVAEKHRADMETALAKGAEYVISWGLTGFNADVNFPDNDQTRGLGLIRPDGSIRREVYNGIRELSGIPPIG